LRNIIRFIDELHANISYEILLETFPYAISLINRYSKSKANAVDMFFLVIIGFLVGVGVLSLLLLRFANRRWWNVKIVRYCAIVTPVIVILGFAALIAGFMSDNRIATALGSLISSFGFVLMVGAVLALPLSGVLNTTASILDKRAAGKSGLPDYGATVDRRKFLKRAAYVFPVLSGGLGVTGFARSFSDVKVHEKPLVYDSLPSQLNGFRILHLSDLHLGRYFKLGNLEALVDELRDREFDLVLVTGDICDVAHQLQDTLRLFENLNSRYGYYASLGNHEYYHGVRKSFDAHSRSNVPLLVNRGEVMDVSGASVFIGGCDDPANLFDNFDSFLRETVDKTVSGAPDSSFKILMSHRPRGFVRASERGIDLTLAGHTHGGQIGFNGRSVFETNDPPNYFWGNYENGNSKLYTSSGVGHWFPFRLGCPAEAPIIILRKT
jgi:predicted MPP superfamily phosphohydrolase